MKDPTVVESHFTLYKVGTTNFDVCYCFSVKNQHKVEEHCIADKIMVHGFQHLKKMKSVSWICVKPLSLLCKNHLNSKTVQKFNHTVHSSSFCSLIGLNEMHWLRNMGEWDKFQTEH